MLRAAARPAACAPAARPAAAPRRRLAYGVDYTAYSMYLLHVLGAEHEFARDDARAILYIAGNLNHDNLKI